MEQTENKSVNATDPAKKPTDVAESKTSAEIAEQERIKAQNEYKEFVEKLLKERNFEEIDERRYSFVYNGTKFLFHMPDFMEKTKIKAILAKIAFVPGANMISSTQEIFGSGDMDLICNTKLLTHMNVLKEEPKEFNIDNISDEDQFNLGYTILLAEREFEDRKKKA